jgi:hypothetical protein
MREQSRWTFSSIPAIIKAGENRSGPANASFLLAQAGAISSIAPAIFVRGRGDNRTRAVTAHARRWDGAVTRPIDFRNLPTDAGEAVKGRMDGASSCVLRGGRRPRVGSAILPTLGANSLTAAAYCGEVF